MILAMCSHLRPRGSSLAFFASLGDLMPSYNHPDVANVIHQPLNRSIPEMYHSSSIARLSSFALKSINPELCTSVCQSDIEGNHANWQFTASRMEYMYESESARAKYSATLHVTSRNIMSLSSQTTHSNFSRKIRTSAT